MITRLDVEKATDEANCKCEAFLESKGWKYNSRTPHGCWMWQKEIDGKVYMVSDTTAMQIEQSLEA